MSRATHIATALDVLNHPGLPRQQRNERSALCLLALLDLRPGDPWENAKSPLLGITPMMAWIRQHYGKQYKPNTRETIRRQTMHQLCDAGIALYNPDDAGRPVNSPRAVYQIEPATLALLRSVETEYWQPKLALYLEQRETLVQRYARERTFHLVSVEMDEGALSLSPGEHSELIRSVIKDFAPRFAPGSALLYVGDTGDKWAHFDEARLISLGVSVGSHGKMPDVVLFFEDQNWLLLVECVTSHGPVDGKRHAELARLFSGAAAGLVFVTAFPSRAIMARYLGEIAWETEVWVADSPSHLIHFNGERFLGPYKG